MTIINTYHIGLPCRSNAPGAGLLAVLAEDGCGQQAVYMAIVGNLSHHNPHYDKARNEAAHWVMNHGSKLPYHQAVTYFPGIDGEKYRY